MKSDDVLPVIMDVTKPNEIKNAVKAGVDKFGRIDILINNAGFGMTGAFEEASDEELRFLMETNYFGVANVIREVLPVMRAQKDGMILNISTKLWPSEYENPNAVDETLERLGVDYVDLLYIHQPAGNWIAGYRQLEKAYKDGKAKSIGISNFEGKYIEELQTKYR